MTNYDNTKIYKYNNYINKKSNKKCSSFACFENNNYSIILLENYPCKTKNESLARERDFIELYECINKTKPLRSNKEYAIDHKEEIKEYKKEYALENVDKIKEYKAQYYLKNKERLNLKHKENYEKKKIENS